MSNLFKVIASTFIFGLFLSAPSLANALINGPIKEVTLQLKWKHQFQFAGYYAAIKKGFYRESGIEVHLKELKPGTNSIDLVVNGGSDFGVAGSDLIQKRSQGMPVVAIGAVYQHSPLALVASLQSGITDLHQLAGKRVSLETHSAEIQAMLKTANLTEHDLKISDHLFNPRELLSGQADAMSVYTSDEIFLLRQENFNYRLFSPRSFGIDFYGDTLFTSEEMIKTQPELVENFRKASMKGWDYALSHADEMVSYILEQYGNRHSREHLLFEAQVAMDLVLSDLIEIGYMHEDRWKHIYETYKSVGMIDGSVNFDSFIYKIKPDYSKFYYTIIAISTVLLMITIVAVVYFNISKKLNLQITESISLRTQLNDHAAELKRSNEALENFASIASHDLQEPLRKIISFGDLLQRHASLENKEQHYLQRMQAATVRMQQFINDLLEFSTINAQPRQFKLIDLNDVVSEVLSDVDTGIEQSGGTLDIGTLPKIYADRFQIRQLFLNLISNAIKFREEGTPIKIKITSQLTSNGFWKISIKDNGLGFDIKYAERILKPFHRLYGMGEYQGSGMGLAICEKIIARHNGAIEIESCPGNGSTFHISLPQNLGQSAGKA